MSVANALPVVNSATIAMMFITTDFIIFPHWIAEGGVLHANLKIFLREFR